MKRITNILMYIIIAISAVMTIYFFLDPHEPRAGSLLIWAYVLLGMGIVSLLVIPLLNIGANPSTLKKGGINIAFMVVLFGIAYVISSGAQTATTKEWLIPPSEMTMRISDAGLYATYILLVVAVVAILFSSVYAGYKKR